MSGGSGTADGRARRHEILPHTADAGIRASATELGALFEEAAAALAEISCDIAPGTEPDSWVDIELEAPDLPGLAFAWLNELIAHGEILAAGLVAAAVVAVDSPIGGHGARPHGRSTAAASGAAWRLLGRAGFRRFAAGGARPRRPPKSAAFHRLAVEREPDGWMMVAYVDI